MKGYAKIVCLVFSGVLLVLLGRGPVAGGAAEPPPQPYRQAEVLFADHGSLDARFGYAIAAAGDVAAIGAPGRTTNHFNDGAAYVFHRGPAGWAQTAFIPPPDGLHAGWFGAALALDGDTLAVAAPNVVGDDGESTGAVFVYAYDGATWQLQAELTPPEPLDFPHYGHALDLDGDTLLVAARNAAYPDPAHVVYVYDRAGAGWTQQGVLTPPDERANFGLAVALSGDVALVGAPGMIDQPAPYDRGAVYVYSRTGGAWSAAGTIAPDDSERGDTFGCDIDFDGATAVVVACPYLPQPAPPQRAYVFTRAGNEWTQTARLDPAYGDSRPYLSAVALDGDRILLGSLQTYNPAVGLSIGAAFLFERGETWRQTQVLRPDDSRISGLGLGVGLAGEDVLVGATNAVQLNEPEQGAVYVFRPRLPGEGLVYLPAAAASPLTQRTGLIAYSSRELDDLRSDLFVITPDGRGRTNLTNLSPHHELDPAWSPDGARLAYVRDELPGRELVIMDFDDGEEVVIPTPGAIALHHLEWSPDGRFIAYDGMRGSGSDVFVVGVDGSPPRNLTNSPATSESAPSWSPDGSWIVFRSEEHGLATMRPDGSDVTPLAGPPQHFSSWPDWSPDGATILYTQDGDGDGVRDLFVVPAAGGEPRRLITNGQDGRWSPDGAQILFTGASGGLFRIDADGGNLTVVDLWGQMGDWQPQVE